VPKGPSYDPRDKRLAARVEDHPVEYASFEGVIPQGEYGAGAVVLWDRGTWTPLVDPALALKKGELKFELHGEKLAGKWALVKIKGDDPKAWLLVKDKDDHARSATELDIVSARPESVVTGRGLAEVAVERDRLWHSRVVRPGGELDPGGPAAGDGGARLRLADLAGSRRAPLQKTQPLALAMVVEAPPAGDEWLHEIKHDGYRIVARIEEGEVRLISRNGKDWTKEFPQVARALGRLPAGTALVDGEVAAVLPNGATSFQALQRRGDAAVPLVFFAFDLLHLDGWDLRGVGLEERKEVLRRFLEVAPDALRFSDHVRGHGPEFFEKAREAGLEGVVSKRADAPYREGRGGDWRKAKCRLTQEVVIGGFTLSSDGGGTIGALLVGFFEGDELVYAGKVGSGFDGRLLADLMQRLEARRRKASPVRLRPRRAAARRAVGGAGPRGPGRAHGVDERRPHAPAGLPRSARRPRRAPRGARAAGHRRGRRRRHRGRGPAVGGAPAARDAHARDERRGGRRSAGRAAHPSGPRLLSRSRLHQAGPGALLRVDRRQGAALSRRPAAHARAVPGRDLGRDLSTRSTRASGRRPRCGASRTRPAARSTSSWTRSPAWWRSRSAGILEIHPWNSRVARLEQPDQVIFDLDPDEALPFSRVTSAARRVRALLSQLGLESFVKTTGGKGLHVCVPLRPERGWEELEEFTRAVAQRLARDEPAAFTANMAKAQRKGKVFVDYLRNVRGANAVGAYSTRARETAPVSVPVDWDELDRLSGPKDFTVAEVPLRVLGFGSGRAEDPWARYLSLEQRVPASLARELAGLIAPTRTLRRISSESQIPAYQE
jgi:bifunctional non-homologous end joining protein LigD